MGIRTHFLDTQRETWSFYLNLLPKIVSPAKWQKVFPWRWELERSWTVRLIGMPLLSSHFKGTYREDYDNYENEKGVLGGSSTWRNCLNWENYTRILMKNFDFKFDTFQFVYSTISSIPYWNWVIHHEHCNWFLLKLKSLVLTELASNLDICFPILFRKFSLFKNIFSFSTKTCFRSSFIF